jgi:phospholipid/cholesterol/gamma-HCH transport system permease protein
MRYIRDIGKYYLLLFQVFKKPEKLKVFWKNIIREIDAAGVSSFGIVTVISLFMGAAMTIQSAFGFESPWIPLYAVGVASRDTLILEFSPTIVSLILAGKVGSNIASEIGTMRVTEQIDALEIMGVNPANFLILPKIIASMFINPFLIIISMFFGLIGGWSTSLFTNAVTSYEYVYGITYDFRPYNVFYALVKTFVFAFLITSISSFHGYYTSGGALEVGKSSTKAVVWSSILILLFNVIITQLMLA